MKMSISEVVKIEKQIRRATTNHSQLSIDAAHPAHRPYTLLWITSKKPQAATTAHTSATEANPSTSAAREPDLLRAAHLLQPAILQHRLNVRRRSPATPHTSSPGPPYCPAKAPSHGTGHHSPASTRHCPGTTGTRHHPASRSTDTRSTPPHIHHPIYAKSSSTDIAAAHSSTRIPSSPAPPSQTHPDSCSPSLTGSVFHCISSSAAASNSVSAYPWLKSCRLLDLRRQLRRHRRTGLVVLRIVAEHRRIRRPVFIELRRKLHKIPRHRRPGQARILASTQTSRAAHGQTHGTSSPHQ